MPHVYLFMITVALLGPCGTPAWSVESNKEQLAKEKHGCAEPRHPRAEDARTGLDLTANQSLTAWHLATPSPCPMARIRPVTGEEIRGWCKSNCDFGP